ncbi:hypothetical protein LTR62_005140 [Meristemomyces frigidus]|uniref:Uncharacterized protein n=1 Tax=Meristemomyces frigidus TaxID=1508187 RepID=A0AAN7TWH4_9PEZI|nr:hypothetical protein LTR62_005140 [Meristemomyces frigidus]
MLPSSEKTANVSPEQSSAKASTAKIAPQRSPFARTAQSGEQAWPKPGPNPMPSPIRYDYLPPADERQSGDTGVTSLSTFDHQQGTNPASDEDNSLHRGLVKVKAKLIRQPRGVEAMAKDEDKFLHQQRKKEKKQEGKEEYEEYRRGQPTMYGLVGNTTRAL